MSELIWVLRNQKNTRSTRKPKKKNTETHTQKPKQVPKILKYRKDPKFYLKSDLRNQKIPKKNSKYPIYIFFGTILLKTRN